MLPVALAAALVVLPPPPEVDMRAIQRWKHLSMTGPRLLADQLQDEATELRKANKPADALPLFNASLLLSPDDRSSAVGRAKTFAALGRYDEQADEYARMLARYPNSYAVWQDVAEGWIDRGKWGEATWCFAHAAGQVPPGELRSQILLREAEYWLGDDHKVDTLKGLPSERLMAAHYALCDALESTADLSRPTRQYALANRAWLRYARGWFTEAASDYDELLKIIPKDIEVHRVRAAIAYESKDYAKALHHIGAAEKHGYDVTRTTGARCITLVVMEEYERAEVEARKWVRLDPTDKKAALYHAITLRLVGKHDEADQVTKSAAVLSVMTFADQVYKEAHVLWEWYGEFDAADRLLTRRITNTTDTKELAEAYYYRGQLRRYRGLIGEALDDLGACIRLCPEHYSPERFGQRWLLGSDDTTTELKAYLPNR